MTESRSGRIQKVLANAGAGSRRQVEAWVAAGRVSVNGRRATPGQAVSPRDRIQIDGVDVTLTAAVSRRVLLYHKPIGEISARRDNRGRPTVFDSLPRLDSGRWVAVGRLDINTVGILLFTTDGELASRLMHPSTRIVREYAARVLGDIDDDALQRLRDGVPLEQGTARFDFIERQGEAGGSNRWYRCRLHGGRKREVRRLFEAVGGKVNRLIRVRFGPLRLPRDLPPGEFRELRGAEREKLYRAVGLTRDH